MDKVHINQILNEQDFPCIKEEIEERNLCLKYLMMTKAFNNSNIVKCLFHKTDGKYILNGMGYIDINNSEFINLSFSSEVTFEGDSIGIYSNITELHNKNNQLLKTEEKETYDYFSKSNDKIIQETRYFNPDKIFETEYSIPNDFNRFYELSKLNNQNSIQR